MLKEGYSPATIQHNVGVELRAKNRRTMRQILAIVYDKARKSYRRSHPRGRFPKHLER
jgi:hypothetical protein